MVASRMWNLSLGLSKIACGLAFSAMVLMAMPAFGQGNGNGRGNGGGGGGGGGGDPLDTGTVYYWSFDFDSKVSTAKSINPDGSSVATLGIVSPYAAAEPSDSLHAGARWFLMAAAIDGELYPDGQPRLEMVAASDAGAIVQIGVDSTLQMVLTAERDMSETAPRWTLNDSRISWMARRWGTDPGTGEPVVVETGLYYVDLSVEVSSLSAPLVPQRFAIDFDETNSGGAGIRTAHSGYDWSPDGELLVLSEPQGLSIADPDTGDRSIVLVPSGTDAWFPRWSVLDQIVFSDLDGLRTINTDGTGLLQIVTGETTSRPGRPTRPLWSPNGTHLVYARLFLRFSSPSLYVEWKTFVSDSTGGSENKVAGRRQIFAIPLGWTQD